LPDEPRAGHPDLAGKALVLKRGLASPVLVPWAERPKWVGPLGSWMGQAFVGAAQCNSVPIHFPFQINSNSTQIKFKLPNFVET
jgi:hypothetical protein